jgi:hypothetical protein
MPQAQQEKKESQKRTKRELGDDVTLIGGEPDHTGLPDQQAGRGGGDALGAGRGPGAAEAEGGERGAAIGGGGQSIQAQGGGGVRGLNP